jgi:hypothetical protein
MTATTHSTGDGSPDPSAPETGQTTAPAAKVAEGMLVGMVSADRCANCGAEMAVDQRYCVECGIRRGRPRFSLASTQSAPESTALVPQSSSARSNATLVAVGLVIVLLALGVGVLIGHDGNSGKQPVNVTVKGATSGATGTAGGASTGSGGSTAAPKSGSSSGGSSKGGSSKGGSSKGGSSKGGSSAPTKTNFFGG